MSADHDERTDVLQLRPATARDLDERMRAAGDVLVGADAGELRPRWIDAAELVRRLSRFTGHN